MRVTHHIPSPPLDAYVAGLWHWEGPPPFPGMAVLPTPALRLMVNLGAAYHVYDCDPGPESAAGAAGGRGGPRASCAASAAVGVWDVSHVVAWPQELRLVNVSFRPGAAYPFLQLPLAELRAQVAPVDALVGRAVADELRERLGEAPTPAARLALLEHMLLARLAAFAESGGARRGRERRLVLAQHAVARIARARGTLAIRALAAELGVSHKHLAAEFHELVGTTPKAMARLYRLQHALACLVPAPARPAGPAQPLRLSWVAQHAGYYDEAHFNHDFAAFTGHTPTEYLRLLRRVHVEHPELAPAPKFLPAW